MKAPKHVLILIALLVMVGLVSAQTQTAAQASTTSEKESAAVQKTLTGKVSDTMCGAKHTASNQTEAECTRACVKQGSDYALVVGKKVYTLKGVPAELDKFAGQRVTVKGKVTGDTVAVESITPAK